MGIVMFTVIVILIVVAIVVAGRGAGVGEGARGRGRSPGRRLESRGARVRGGVGAGEYAARAQGRHTRTMAGGKKI
jgi:hypothetical protein